MEQLRRAVARVGARNALLAARLAARETTPPGPVAASAAAHDVSDASDVDLPDRAGAAAPADTRAAASGGACAAPGNVLPGSTSTCAQHGAEGLQQQSVAGSTLPPDSLGDSQARRGATAAQEPWKGSAKPSTGPEGVAAALARRVAALAAERRVLKALARLSLAVTTDVLTGAHALKLEVSCAKGAVRTRLGHMHLMRQHIMQGQHHAWGDDCCI